MLDYGFNNFQNITLYSSNSCAASGFLYPSLYFGQKCTVDSLRSTCTATVPLNTDASQLTSSISQGDGQLTKTYLYSGYPVAAETVSTSAIQTLLTSSPSEAGIASGQYSPSLLTEISQSPAVQQTASLARRLPSYTYILAGLLLLLIIMEIFLFVRKSRRRKARKHRRTNGRQRR